jgi:hypothetical protein
MPRSSRAYNGNARTTPASPTLVMLAWPRPAAAAASESAGTTASTISGVPSDPIVSVSAVGSTVGVRCIASTKTSSPGPLSANSTS